MTQRIRQAARELAFAFQVKGLMNVQCAVVGNEIYLIEVNPRASRTVPFVAKAIGVPLAKIAAKIMAGAKLKDFHLPHALDENMTLFHVKGPVFPFSRFDRTDTILGPEMRSTGEVMGRAPSFGGAFSKALAATNVKIPRSGRVFISVRNEDKEALLPIARELRSLGFIFSATQGTYKHLRDHHIDSELVKKLQEGGDNCVEMIKKNRFSLVINTTSDEKAVEDSYAIRRSALETRTPCLTTISAAFALLRALDTSNASLEVYPL
jgi:carbamoyl-phosphate synthase large subunit